MEYANKIKTSLTDFPVTFWANESMFVGFDAVLEQLQTDLKKAKTNLKLFGNFDSNSALGEAIHIGVKEGNGLNEYSFLPKIRLKAEFEKINLN